MVREEILVKSKELVNQIYEKMNVIETCDSVAEKVKNLDVCFNDSVNKQIVSLDVILSQGQLSTIRENIVNIIYSNATEAQSFLERLNQKPATINPDFVAAVQGMIKEAPVAKADQTNTPVFRDPSPAVAPELNYEDVRRMYIDEEKTQGEIAKHFNATKSQVNTFLQKNNLFRNNYKKADIFRDAEVEKRRRERP